MGGVFCGATITLQRYGSQRDQQYNGQCEDKYPDRNRRLIGKVLLPMSNDQIGSRSRQHEAYQDDNSISTIEHVQNIADCSTIGFAQSDLFATILRFKQNQSESPQRRYQHGQQTEQRNLSGLATLLFVHIADRLIKKSIFKRL